MPGLATECLKGSVGVCRGFGTGGRGGSALVEFAPGRLRLGGGGGPEPVGVGPGRGEDALHLALHLPLQLRRGPPRQPGPPRAATNPQ